MTRRSTSSPDAPWYAGEATVRLSALPQHLPPLPSGDLISTTTVYRWAFQGLHGIKLRRFKLGGFWHTTREEVVRWSAAITEAVERPE